MTADNTGGVFAGNFENGCDHRADCGFAMAAGYGDAAVRVEEKLCQEV